jgi:hypothetical protein
VSAVSIPFGQGALEVRLTPRAKEALGALRAPLDIELELYFSCLIRKRVNIRVAAPVGRDAPPTPSATACGKLGAEVSVSFRPVMTKACSLKDVAGAPDLETFPIVNARAFTPKWLELDHRHDGWRGAFGW